MSEQILSQGQQISNWETLERILKTLSIVAIPVVLGVGSWIIQARLQNQTVSRDYVQLAVSILKEPKASNIDPEMRTWAVELLNENSPTKFNKQVFDQLKAGTTQLPESFSVTQPVAPVSAAANPRSEATDWELKGFEALVNKDAEGALQAFTNAENLWPVYHNVSEIRKLLQESLSTLAAAPKEGKSEPWSNLYRTLTSKYSFGMPPEIRAKLIALS